MIEQQFVLFSKEVLFHFTTSHKQLTVIETIKFYLCCLFVKNFIVTCQCLVDFK